MTSRKSSILKPRKAREPLQDLNHQLFPNNDDEETTTEVQKRRVSFASMNKVKEFEVAAECVTLLNTPGYDERVYSSSSSSVSSVEIVVQEKSINPVNPTENVCPTHQFIPENVIINDDIELTETINRIYDTPMKSSGDSTMEITEAVGRVTEFVDTDIVEMDLTNKTNITGNNDDSNMETTEIISNVIIKDESLVSCPNTSTNTSTMKLTSGVTNDVLFETIQNQLVLYENCADPDLSGQVEYVSMRDAKMPAPPRKSIFEMSGRQSVVSNQWQDGRKSIFDSQADDILPEGILDVCTSENEMMSGEKTNLNESKTTQLDKADDEVSNIHVSIHNVSTRGTETPAPPRKSIFEMSRRQSAVLNQWQVSRQSISTPQTDAVLLSMLDANISKNEIIGNKSTDLHEFRRTQLDKSGNDDSSIHLLSQPQACSTKFLSQLENKTKMNNSSMQLLSQENVEDVSKLINVDDRTQYNNSSMQLMSQEDGNKTEYDNASMHLMSQDSTNKTNYNQLSMQLATQEMKYSNDDEPEKFDENIPVIAISPKSSDKGLINKQPLKPIDEKKLKLEIVTEKTQPFGIDENALEIMQKSLADTSSSNDSSSPLQLGVNVSIFIDPKKKKNSVPNVHVNITNNKKQQKQSMKELRFSMPATSRSAMSEEMIDRPEFWATFTTDSIPTNDSKWKDQRNVIEMTKEKSNVEETGKKRLNLALDSGKTEDMLKLKLSKPTQKRLSSDAFEEQTDEGVVTKRRSLDDCHTSEPVVVDNTITNTMEQQQQVVVTEIKECRESILHECKSVVTVDNVTMETTNVKSTDLNFSLESRQITTIGSPEESKRATCGSSATLSSLKMKDQSPEIRSDTGSIDQSFSTFNRTPSQHHQTRSINQSAFHEDDTADYSFHNPSIIVNIGDSFSHYKSMDLGVDEKNDALTGDSAKIETKNLIDNIDSESMSKENFVTDWLQNKMNKMSKDGKSTEKTNLAASSGSSSTETSTLTTAAQKTADERRSVDDEVSTLGLVIESPNEPISEEKILTEPSNVAVVEITPKSSLIKDNKSPAAPILISLNENNQLRHNIVVADQKIVHERNEDNESPKIQGDVSKSGTGIKNIQPKEENDRAFSDYRTTDEQPSISEIIENQNANLDGNDEHIVKLTSVVNPTAVMIDPIIAEKTELMNIEMERVSLDDTQPIRVAGKTAIDEILAHMEIDNVDEDEEQLIVLDEISIEEKYEQIRLSSARYEKRKNVSPECERIENVERSLNAPISTPLSRHTTNSKKQDPASLPDPSCDKNQKKIHSKTTEDVKKETLEKIDRECELNTEWRLKTMTDKEWIFEFLYGHLELSINFCDDDSKSKCITSMHFVPVSKKKAVELLRIAINSVIRKYESCLKSLCHTVEDVPYLLKLVVPDILYAKKFVIAMLKLEDSEYVRMRNDKALFYVSSYKNHILLKIMVNIKYLESTGVNDIEVIEFVGKANMDLIRRIFSEAGRDYDFFAKFVRRLWQVLDPREPN